MAELTADTALITTADGQPLKLKLRQSTRINRIKAFALVVPLLVFILVTFAFPLADMLTRSVRDPTVAKLLPRTTEALKAWDGTGQPPDSVYLAIAEEMVARRQDRTIGKVAGRLNYEITGARSLVQKTGRKLARREDLSNAREILTKIDRRWADPLLWRAIRRLSRPFTLAFYVSALDYTYNAAGKIVAQPEDRRIYIPLFLRTLWVSLSITGFCLLLGYPISYLMATLPLRTSNLLMIMVLLPFWTSLLVRTTAWVVLLQRQGVINDLLVWFGIIGDNERLQMIYNMTGTIIAMTHILLPFMVLPLFSVMKGISPSYVRAARSLGASPARAFWRVYFPQTVPGIGAGSLLVFILAIGYYITPALVGGRTGQLISNMIAYHMQKSLNWGLASALGGLLLVGVLALYWLYNRIVGINNMKLG